MINMPDIRSYSAKTFAAYSNTGLPTAFRALKGDNGVDITIYDVIGTAETNAATFQAMLDDAAGAPLTIHMSSPGGSVFEGVAMANILRNYSGSSTIIVDGLCASIATIIALAANQVLIAPNALFMVHSGWIATLDNAEGLRQSAAVLDKIDANLMQAYAAKTGQDAGVWAAKMAAETWFTAQEAVDAGLCDGLYQPDEQPVAARPVSAMMALLEEDAVIRAKLRVRRALASASL